MLDRELQWEGCTGSFQRHFLVSEKRDNASVAGCLESQLSPYTRGMLA